MPGTGSTSSTASQPQPKWKGYCKTFGMILFCFIIFGIIGYLGSKGYINTAIDHIVDLGPAAHAIFIGLYIFCAMPFGAGYSIIITACGYAFGWKGLFTTEAGTFIGASLAFLLSRHGFRDTVKAKIEKMKPKTKRILKTVDKAITAGKGGFMLQTGLRVNPVLVMGWCNAFLAVTQTSLGAFLASTMLGTQVDIVMKTNVGVILRSVGDLSGSSGETKKVMQMNLAIQVGVFLVVLIGGTAYSRWIMRTQFSNLDDDDKTAEGSEGVRPANGNTIAGSSDAYHHSQTHYEGRGMMFFKVLFRREGSIVVRTLPVAFMSSVVSMILMVIRAYTLVPAAWLPVLKHPIAVQMLGIVLGYVVVLRSNVAVDRYFEGMTNLQFFASKWADAFAQLCAFIRTSAKIHMRDKADDQVDQLEKLQLELLHWFSILHGLAINSLQTTQLDAEDDEYFNRLNVCPLPTLSLRQLIRDEGCCTSRTTLQLDGRKTMKRATVGGDSSSVVGLKSQSQDLGQENLAGDVFGNAQLAILGELTANELKHLHRSDDKVDQVHSWIIEAIAAASLDRTLLTQSPILSRVYQELSNGMLGYNQAYKIALVQFPFAFAQMLTLFLLAFALLCPVAVFIFTGGEFLTPALTLFTVLGFWGIHEIAVEIENPFGLEVNHLPLVPLHECICESFWEASLIGLPYADDPEAEARRPVNVNLLRSSD